MNTWWDILVNKKLLVAVKGRDTADFMMTYLAKDTQNAYEIIFSSKNIQNTIKCVTPKDIIDPD